MILVVAWGYALLASSVAVALGVNTTSQIKASAQAIANQLVDFYPTTNLDEWWEGGQIYGSLVDYISRTGDQKFTALVAREIARQAGDAPPYFQPADLSQNITNYGQARWALTAILAEEVGFIRDPALVIGYLQLAEDVFDQIASRWDELTCGGGLNTTIYASSEPSKDLFSVGEFFQLAARLAIHTNNGTYTAWAEQIFDWATTIGLVNTAGQWNVYNSADLTVNCTNIDKTAWSINAGELLYGTSLMYNLTYSQSWVTRTTGVLQYINETFFANNVVYEPSCNIFSCDPGERTYRAVLVKFMAKSAMSAPFVTVPIQWTLTQSGTAIAQMCSAPVGGNSTCTINGQTGIGEQLTGLNSVVSLLIGRNGNNQSSPAGQSSPTPPARSGAVIRSASWAMVSLTVVLTSFFFLSS